jgi:5-methylcytosine-specific restriction enzyme A
MRRIRETREKKYDHARWKRLRRQQLQAYPLCALCEARGQKIAAEVVHHLVPHKGDITLFYTSALQSLCKRCHDGIVQKIEKVGYSNEVGPDGFYTDPAHPTNKGRRR